MLELGDKALIAGNLFDQTGVDSIAPVDFDGLRCWNNTFLRAGWRRGQADTSITDWFSNPRVININRSNRIPRGTVSYGIDARAKAGTIPPWPVAPGHSPGSSGGNEFRNNVVCYPNTQQFIADEDFRKSIYKAISYAQAGTNADYNLYQADPAVRLQYPWNWSSSGSGNTTAFSIGEVRTKFNQEHHGIQLTTSAMCVDPATGQLTGAHSSLHASAAPLPSDVAAALGQPAGSRHFGNYPLAP